jgi:hypothetical protein
MTFLLGAIAGTFLLAAVRALYWHLPIVYGRIERSATEPLHIGRHTLDEGLLRHNRQLNRQVWTKIPHPNA